MFTKFELFYSVAKSVCIVKQHIRDDRLFIWLDSFPDTVEWWHHLLKAFLQKTKNKREAINKRVNSSANCDLSCHGENFHFSQLGRSPIWSNNRVERQCCQLWGHLRNCRERFEKEKIVSFRFQLNRGRYK